MSLGYPIEKYPKLHGKYSLEHNPNQTSIIPGCVSIQIHDYGIRITSSNFSNFDLHHSKIISMKLICITSHNDSNNSESGVSACSTILGIIGGIIGGAEGIRIGNNIKEKIGRGILGGIAGGGIGAVIGAIMGLAPDTTPCVHIQYRDSETSNPKEILIITDSEQDTSSFINNYTIEFYDNIDFEPYIPPGKPSPVPSNCYIKTLSDNAGEFTFSIFRSVRIMLPNHDKVEYLTERGELTECYVFLLNYLIDNGYERYISGIHFNYDFHAFSHAKRDTLKKLKNGLLVNTRLGNIAKIGVLKKIFKNCSIPSDWVEFIVYN